MSRWTGRPRWRRGAAAVLAAASLASACTGSPTAEPGAGPPAWPSPSATPDPAVPALEVDVARIRGFAVKGRARPRHLRGPARAVADTVDRLYTAAFVDPRSWEGGFGAALREFRGPARDRARKDIDQLTVGRAAAVLSEVRPDRARLRVDLLLGRGRNSLAAVARMDFAATGLSTDGVETPIRHRAQYLLRRFDGRWHVVAYRVKKRLVPERVPGVPAGGTLYVLVIGSDARPGQAVARARADSLHIIGVNLRRRKASIVGIPRDSYVPIPGRGTQKINAALFHGGPDLVVRTVEQLTGIRMDGYLLTGFEGFRRMVTRIGGVALRIPYRMSDAASGAYFQPGPKRLKGRGALAFSRNRHDAPGGDFARSLNQGSVMLAALRELRRDVAGNPAALFRWVAIAAQHLHTDLGPLEQVELLIAALTIEPRKVRNRVVSGGGGFAGGASVVFLGGGARAMFQDLRRDGVLGG
jgi:LCP family protein required for cell wall assembly